MQRKAARITRNRTRPKSLKSLLKQRLRWVRGNLKALGDLIRSKVSIKEKALITFLFFMLIIFIAEPTIAITEILRKQIETLTGT